MDIDGRSILLSLRRADRSRGEHVRMPYAARVATATVVGLAAVSLTAASSASATGSTAANRHPICNSVGFNLPATVGGTVTIPVTGHAANPDLTPTPLVGVFGGAPLGSVVISDNGTAATTNEDVLIFTRTSGSRGAPLLDRLGRHAQRAVRRDRLRPAAG
ncbi:MULTISPECIES: hypothetical protein [unclassified Micromonospora]|uniref:hypothetical protein n=1 Tax=unclassified Micromonospora TaxID=2617518 RepID=UPI003A85F92F